MLLTDKEINEMKNLAKILVPYSFPIVSPEDEDIISCLKQREMCINGYDVIVYFNNCSYTKVSLKTLQIYGKYFTALPFFLVCQCAYRFLGDKELSFVEVHSKNNYDIYRKIYVWTVYYDKDNNPIENPFAKDVSKKSYDGLQFSKLNRGEITFF